MKANETSDGPLPVTQAFNYPSPIVEVDAVAVELKSASGQCTAPVVARAPSAYAAIGVAGELERQIVPNNSCIGRIHRVRRDVRPRATGRR
jgi:hypothetical protein